MSEKGLTAAIMDSFGRIERQVTIPRSEDGGYFATRTLSAWNGVSHLVVTGSAYAIIGAALDNNCDILEPAIPLGDMHGEWAPMALTAEGDGFLLLASKRANATEPRRDDIYGIRITSGGVAGEWFLVRSVASRVTGLGAVGDVVVWSDEFGLWMLTNGGPSRQLAQAAVGVRRLVIAGGRTWIAYGGEMVIAVDGAGNVTPQPQATDIASNGSSVLAVKGVEGRFLAPAATQPFIVAKSQTDQQRGNLAGDGQNLIAVWDEEIDGKRQIFAGRYDAGRNLRTASGIRISGDGDNSGPSVAFNGRDYLIAWGRKIDGRENEVAARRLSASGEVLDTEDLILGDTPVAYPSVASDGSNWLVLWSERLTVSGCNTFGYGVRLFAARVGPSGVLLDPGGVPIAPQLPTDAHDFDVAWTGTNYIAAWETRCVLGKFTATVGVDAAFISSDLSSIATLTLSKTAEGATHPRIVPGSDRSLIVWQKARDIQFEVVANASPPTPSRRRVVRTKAPRPRPSIGTLVAAGKGRNGELAIVTQMAVPWALTDQGIFETIVAADGTLSPPRLLFIVDPDDVFMGRMVQMGASRFLSDARFDPAAGAQRMWLRELD